jgi:hypothetical protein
MNIQKYHAKDEVIVDGMDGIFTVEAYFEQMIVENNKEVFELWYTVRDKQFGGCAEVRYNRLSSASQKKKDNIDGLLDEYNSCLKIGKILNSTRCKREAKYIIHKLKSGSVKNEQ